MLCSVATMDKKKKEKKKNLCLTLTHQHHHLLTRFFSCSLIH